MYHLTLAPMEGVLDSLMRDLLTRNQQYDLCVTEFVRVSRNVLPEKVFYKLSPELLNGGTTPSGTPVRVQLLGQDPALMGANANVALSLGSPGIDVNFGCPSKMVNGSNGGAALLKTPELMYQIISRMRQDIGHEQILSAKMRLGWDNSDYAIELADAIYQGGANALAVHGRTKVDGYKKGTVKWQAIGDIAKAIPIELTANGDIVDKASADECARITGCKKLMVGRGALNIPNLGAMIKESHTALAWHEVLRLIIHYSELEMSGDKGSYFPNRIKQWFSYLRLAYPEAAELFMNIRIHKTAAPIIQTIQAELTRLDGK